MRAQESNGGSIRISVRPVDPALGKVFVSRIVQMKLALGGQSHQCRGREWFGNGFAALAAIASNVTGSDIGTLMTQRVLRPLGLDDSFFDTNVARLPAGAVQYDPMGHPIPYYTTSTPASGELYASAHDLARFAMFNMKNRVEDQRRILDDRWIDELHRPVFVGPSGIATTFGWFTGHLESGLLFLFKGGGQPGVATFSS